MEWGENVIKKFVKEENTGDEEKEGRMPQCLGFPFPQSVQLVGLVSCGSGDPEQRVHGSFPSPTPPHTPPIHWDSDKILAAMTQNDSPLFLSLIHFRLEMAITSSPLPLRFN